MAVVECLKLSENIDHYFHSARNGAKADQNRGSLAIYFRHKRDLYCFLDKVIFADADGINSNQRVLTNAIIVLQISDMP